MSEDAAGAGAAVVAGVAEVVSAGFSAELAAPLLSVEEDFGFALP